ncbi:MAG: hypothetical protein WA091_00660 [Minisyncoccales bacterium]
MKNIIYWLPRVIAVLFVILVLLFSFDVFSSEGSFLEKMEGFLIQNIPTIILALSLAFAWKEEKKGGYLFIILALAFTAFFKTYERMDTFLLISFPLILIGALFILNKKEA